MRTRPHLHLVAEALRRDEGRLSADGAFMVETGVHTGRSVQDKFVVDEPSVTADIWWGKVNQRMTESSGSTLTRAVCRPTCRARNCSPRTCMRAPIRTIACASGWSRRRPGTRCSPATCSSARAETELAGFEPDYVILHAPLFQTDPED